MWVLKFLIKKKSVFDDNYFMVSSVVIYVLDKKMKKNQLL